MNHFLSEFEHDIDETEHGQNFKSAMSTHLLHHTLNLRVENNVKLFLYRYRVA